MSETSTRRFVPEDDPIYVEEVQKTRVSHSELGFGHNVKSYDVESKQCQRDIQHWGGQLKQIEDGLIDDPEGKEKKECERLLGAAQKQDVFHFKQYTERLAYEFSNLVNALLFFSQNYSQEELNYIRSELGRMFGLPEIQAELSQFLDPESGELDFIRFKEALQKNLVSGEFLFAITRSHLKQIDEQKDELEQFTQSAKAEFKKAVIEAVESGFLPQAALDNLHRVDQIEVRLEDFFNNMFNSGKAGSNHGVGLITVVNTQLIADPSRLRHFLFHEFVHEISGKSISITKASHQAISDTRQSIQVIDRKVGLSLSDRHHKNYQPNEWVNEAVTEQIALQLSGYRDNSEGSYKGSRSYPKERRELDRLFRSGLEEGLAKEAYFENFSSAHPEGLGQHYSKVVRRINEVEEDKRAWNRLNAGFSIDKLTYQLNQSGFYSSSKSILSVLPAYPQFKWHKIKIRFLYGKNYEERELIFIEKSSTDSGWKEAQGYLQRLKKDYGGRLEFEIEESPTFSSA